MATSKNKKSIPASDSRYKNMTPAQRNANTLKNVKESIGSTKKTDVKKPADTKKPVTVNNAKGKTTYDPKARTVTTYNSKGKTVEDKKNNKTTTYNKQGKTTVGTWGKEVQNKKGSSFVANDKSLGKQVTVRDKKGTRFYGDDKLLREDTKEGTKFYYLDGTGTLINSKGSKAIPPAKKETTKKATNLPEVKVTPPKKTTPASNNTSIEQKAKDAMSGKYGSGAARKTALGSDYAKVQTIINKKATATKAKPTGPSKGTVATMQKNIKDEQEGRLKFDEPVASVSTKSTEVKPEVKPAAVDVDKSIDAAMKAIAKSKIMKKGGMVKKMQYGGTPKIVAKPVTYSRIKKDNINRNSTPTKYGGKPTLLKPANNSLANKPTKSLAYKNGVKPTNANPKTGQQKAKYGMTMKKMQDGGTPKLTGAELKRRGEAKKRMGNEMKANGESSKRIGEAQKAAYMRKKSEATYKKKNVRSDRYS